MFSFQSAPDFSGERWHFTMFDFGLSMKIITITKRGKTRTIYAPTRAEKAALRAHVPGLMDAARAADRHGVQHGFCAGRSPVTNARQHVGRRFTLCFDLADFFESVKPVGLLEGHAVNFFPDGAARQGLPTSPAIANIAASPMDSDIMSLRRSGRFTNFVYTRYADDLTFSFDHPDVADLLMREVPRIAERHGFSVNERKTHLQCADAGRRMVTGVAVDTQIHVPRSVKRRIRAARHQRQSGITRRTAAKFSAARRLGDERSMGAMLAGQLRGLEEWSRLKLPRQQAAAPASAAQSAVVPSPAAMVRPPVGEFRRKFAL